MTAIALGVPYITRAELVALQPKLPLSEYTDDDQDNIILLSSRVIDSYCHTEFGAQVYAEQYEWRTKTRRCYPDHWPIIAVARFRIAVSNTSYSDIDPDDIYIQNDEHFVEAASMAVVVGLSPEIVSLGMTTPMMEISYAAGYGAFTDSGETVSGDLNASDTEIPVSSEAPFGVGDVVRLGDEWVQVSSTEVGKIHVTARGGYGTTATAHTDGTTIELLSSSIPSNVKVAAALTAAGWITDQTLQAEGLGGMKQATIGSYSITLANERGVGGLALPPAAEIILGPYRKITLGGG